MSAKPDPSRAERLPPLPHGTWVRVFPVRDVWLRRFSGVIGVVVGDDRASVEVAFPGGGRESFWRGELEVIEGGPESVAGSVLRVERRRAGVSQGVIARELGVSAGRISQIERQIVPRGWARRYREALVLAARAQTDATTGAQSTRLDLAGL